MSWRDALGPAKFRGVSFFVSSSERSGGRRVVRHEFPKRDTPYSEDMGRKARTFPVEGYVLGADYNVARDALISALEEAGPGELVHPYHGVRRVVVTDFRVRETTDEGGIARFSIEFAETDIAPAQPTVTADAGGQLLSSAAAARAASEAEFSAQFAPGFHMDSIVDALRSATLAIDSAVLATIFDAQARAAFRARLEEFSDSAESLANVPADLLVELAALFDDFTDYGSAVAVYSFDPGAQPVDTTENRTEERQNFDATQRIVQRYAIIRAAELVLDESFDTFEDAVAARETITDLLDDQAENAADDVYPSLLQLRADVVKAVPGDADLPHLTTHTPLVTLPSLVIAHQLYGHLDLEADLIARNRVKHPGFVTGGYTLSVLTDG